MPSLQHRRPPGRPRPQPTSSLVVRSLLGWAAGLYFTSLAHRERIDVEKGSAGRLINRHLKYTIARQQTQRRRKRERVSLAPSLPPSPRPCLLYPITWLTPCPLPPPHRSCSSPARSTMYEEISQYIAPVVKISRSSRLNLRARR